VAAISRRRRRAPGADFAAPAVFGALMTGDAGNEGVGWALAALFGLLTALSAVYPEVLHGPHA